MALAATAVVVPLLTGIGVAQASAAAQSGYRAHGSIDQAYELGAPMHTKLELVNGAGTVVGRGTTDRYGSLIIYNQKPGPGYQFRAPSGGLRSNTFSVLSTHSTPPNSFYSSQHMHAGLNYITMRDGVSLAATVRLPPGKTLADGPFPTVIEYSGYAIAAPGNLLDALLNPSELNNPLMPDTATAIGSAIAPLIGFASVSIQMRGTGCSGGAFDLFGLPTTYDGYDMVQTVAAQPWVAHHHVGLVGISFSGISQYFVAGTRPPGLAAVAPMSSLDDLYSVGFPGGMFNSGFAASWISQRLQDAKPAPQGGLAYAAALIRDGDKTCLANQRLHLQVQNVAAELASPYRNPAVYNIRSPLTWAKKIDVPVFATGALQDEQTGPEWEDLISAMDGDPHVFATMINGAHVDSLGPAIIIRLAEFLNIFVADRDPTVPANVEKLSGLLYQQLAGGAPSEPLPPLRFTHAKTVAVARAEFEAQDPRVRVLFDNGGGSAGPGAFQPEWEADFSSWPVKQAVTTTDYLGPSGTLTPDAPAASSTSFRPNPAARPQTSLSASANAWAAQPPYDWAPVTGSEGLGFVTAPLAADEVVVGPASLNLWLKSSAKDTDLQVTVSEVRPNGQEIYVESGFLRASDRALNQAQSTALRPVPTFLKSEARPLPAGRYSLVRIPIDPIGYAFRKGSRIRVIISAPGGDRPAWIFNTPNTHGSVLDTVSLGGAHPSSFVFPVVPGVTPPDSPPACGALRGEPCRQYVPAGNGG